MVWAWVAGGEGGGYDLASEASTGMLGGMSGKTSPRSPSKRDALSRQSSRGSIPKVEKVREHHVAVHAVRGRFSSISPLLLLAHVQSHSRANARAHLARSPL